MAHFQAPSASDPTSYYIENGRAYSTHRRGQYLLPIDATEQERLDIMHALILAARDKHTRLHNAPFVERQDPRTGEPPRVLDLGCGTGIWLVDMAEKYAKAHLLGVDLYNMAPQELFQNVEMRSPIDYEAPWALGLHSFDFIHLQMALGSVSNWLSLYGKIFDHLKPGGWFEHVEIDFQPRCDDGTLRSGKYTDWWEKYVAPPFAGCGRPLAYNPQTGELLQRTGFIDIEHKVYRIPANGTSTTSRSEHKSGTWWNIAMQSGQGYGNGFEALSLAVLTRLQGWPESHARKLCEEAQAEAFNPDVHSYNELHIWWARSPPTTAFSSTSG